MQLAYLLKFLEGWHFDLISSALTIFAFSLFTIVMGIIRKSLLEGSKYVISGLLYALSITLTKEAAAWLTLRKYCQLQLSGSSKNLYVPGMRDVTLNIDSIFVPLSLEQTGRGERLNHRSVVEAGARIRIIGDPGSGKSTIAKRIFRDECKKGVESPRSSRFPILLEIRKIPFPKRTTSKNSGEWFLNFIIAEIKKRKVYDVERCFDSYAKTNGLLIILDGLDEISSTLYSYTEAAILDISDRLDDYGIKNVIILTMRIQFHQQVRSAYNTRFTVVLELRPFTPTDIYEFLRRWEFSEQKTRSREIVRIYSDLTDRPTLREMCANPLVLSMYVAQDQATGHPIAPESRTEFYLRVTEELLIKRRTVQLGVSEAQAVLKEQRERIFGRIAFEHLVDPEQAANVLSWVYGVHVVQEITKLNYKEAEIKLRQLSIDTGIITEEKEGETFRFIHLTFCEFLAAFEAIQGRASGWADLIEFHRKLREHASSAARSRLIEVLPFSCALMPRHMRERAIYDLEALGDQRVLTLSFLETKAYDHPIWPQFIEMQQAGILARLDDQVRADWLREVHLFMVTCGDADRAANVLHSGQHSGDKLTRFFSVVAERSDNTIIRLIDSYATQDAAAAFRVATLCKIDLLDRLTEVIVQHCDQPPFLAIVIERASHDTERMWDWSCAIAEGGLRSSAAAHALSQSNNDLWSIQIDKIEKTRRWFSIGVTSRNPYTECITYALSRGKVDETKFPMLGCLARVGPPNSVVYIATLLTSVLALIATLATLLFVQRLTSSDFMGVFYFIALVSVVAIFSQMIAGKITSVRRTYHMVYEQILSLRDWFGEDTERVDRNNSTLSVFSIWSSLLSTERGLVLRKNGKKTRIIRVLFNAEQFAGIEETLKLHPNRVNHS